MCGWRVAGYYRALLVVGGSVAAKREGRAVLYMVMIDPLVTGVWRGPKVAAACIEGWEEPRSVVLPFAVQRGLRVVDASRHLHPGKWGGNGVCA